MPDINEEYERKHRRNLLNVGRKIRELYVESINTLTFTAGKIKYNGTYFNLNKFPLLKLQIEAQAKKMHASIYSTVVNSIEDSWNLSTQKNNLFIDRRLAGKVPADKVKRILYDPNKDAMQAFILRKDKGLDLSKRVWKLSKKFSFDMERGLLVGIRGGQSAREMARDMTKYLNDPDKLFRRIREVRGDKTSKLVFSKPYIEEPHTPGVYKNSYKNALRLTRTETNISYRSADHERWKNLPFVIGIEIKLSNAHPMTDICDVLVGKYPKDYKHTGFHPQCLCYAVALMMNDEEYEKYEDQILGISDEPFMVSQIETVPPQFNDWLKENKRRVKAWKNPPYWIKDNKQYIGDLLK